MTARSWLLRHRRRLAHKRLWNAWKACIATEGIVIDKEYRNNVFLSSVVDQVTEFAIKHIHQQYLLLQGREYRKAAGEVRTSDLRPCTNTYEIFMGMPCSHMLHSLDGNAIALQKTDFHPHLTIGLTRLSYLVRQHTLIMALSPDLHIYYRHRQSKILRYCPSMI